MAYLKSIDVKDRFSYYICINMLRSLSYKTPYIFLDEADEFFELVKGTLHPDIDPKHLYLIARMSLDISILDPQVVRRHASVIDSLESAALMSKNTLWQTWTMQYIAYIRADVR